MSELVVRTGDWVQFYMGGVPQIAEVLLVKKREPHQRSPDVCTTRGVVALDNLLEVRREPQWCHPEEEMWAR
jgi:hypothetical protein